MQNKVHASDLVLSPYLPAPDREVCLKASSALHRLVTANGRRLVFFVGAGVSVGTLGGGMPLTSDLLCKLLLDAIERASVAKGVSEERWSDAARRASSLLGFEITLNDLSQICPAAVAGFFQSLSELEDAHCHAGSAHRFLARWLASDGVVLTTNYDRLIERARRDGVDDFAVRYSEAAGPASFETWLEGVRQGGCLFKLHGSLADPSSCLGALEDVGTQLRGNRAQLLSSLARERPLCFIGWRGADPDIPLLLEDVLGKMPAIWVHHEGDWLRPATLAQCIANMPQGLTKVTGLHHLITDAHRLFTAMGSWLGWESSVRELVRPTASAWPDFSHAFRTCTSTGLGRFAGISLRRANDFSTALEVLKMSHAAASSPVERSAATQEMSLTFWARGRPTDRRRAEALVERGHQELRESAELGMRLNADFGLLSMKVLAVARRPWLLLRLPHLFKVYAADIAKLRRARRDEHDERAAALHESLYQLYLGRLRLMLTSCLGPAATPLASWVLGPFQLARATIDGAGDIHIHSRVDVLSYRSLALARFGHSHEAWKDIPEVERLCRTLSDQARSKHFFEEQLPSLEKKCPRPRLD